jgi:ABC-2 type transport system ATP-binding protein
MSFLEATDVVKRYGSHTALDHVSLSVDEGTIYGLLGPNGAGKTSLIRIVNQITCPDSGQLCIDNRPMKPSDVNQIGYLPEERGLYKKMRVADHIVYLARLKGMSKADAVAQMRIWVERFDLGNWVNKKIEALSKGMAQKVQFIGTVIHRPRLLIFDEPFSGFDPVNAEILKQEIVRLRDEGATILFSTHNMGSVEAVCQNISLINHAKVVLQGNVDQIRQQFKKHVFSVTTTDGPLTLNNDLYTIEKIAPCYGGIESTIRLMPGVAIRDVLSKINNQNQLGGFQELLPSMHEIFIETVTCSNANIGEQSHE